jgi:hypothetical protein
VRGRALRTLLAFCVLYIAIPGLLGATSTPSRRLSHAIPMSRHWKHHAVVIPFFRVVQRQRPLLWAGGLKVSAPTSTQASTTTVTSPTTTESVPPSSTTTVPVASWQQLVLSYHDWNGPLMLRVAWCESRDESWAVSSEGATGIFQILVGGSTDPIVNTEQAHALWLVQGLQAWSASEGCWA